MAMEISEADFLNYLRSPSLFMWKVLGVKPVSYQVELLEDDSPSILFIGGRQIGKSTTLAAKALWNAFVKPQQDILLVSKTQRQSRVIFQIIYRFIVSNTFLQKHTDKLNLTEIRFDNQSVIRCLPAGKAGETIRGFAATHIIYDEAAFIPDEVFTAVSPSMSVRGVQVIYSSTPNGKRGFFYTMFLEESQKSGKARKTSIYRVKSTESPITNQEHLKQLRQIMTTGAFQQEFETEFLDEVGMFFSYSLIYASTKDYEYKLPIRVENDERYYLGIDVAYSGSDDTGLVLVKEYDVDKKRQVVWADTRSKLKIVDLVGQVTELVRTTPIHKVYVDKTGVGAGVYELLRESVGGIVVGVESNEANRNRMYGAVKLYLEQKRLTLCLDDNKMLQQFSSYVSKYDVNGKLRITKDATMHDDLTDALALTFIDVSNGEFSVLEEGLSTMDSQVGLDTRPHVLPDLDYAILDGITGDVRRIGR